MYRPFVFIHAWRGDYNRWSYQIIMQTEHGIRANSSVFVRQEERWIREEAKRMRCALIFWAK
jgi:hypothetical protein